MRKILKKIIEVLGRDHRTLPSKNKKRSFSEKKQDLYNAELMPSGFFDRYQKILYEPGRIIEQIKNE